MHVTRFSNPFRNSPLPHGRLIPLFVALLIPWVVAADEPPADDAIRAELQSVRAEILALEQQVQEQVGERWRIRHGIKYGDDRIIPLRQEAREAQRALLEIRTRLTDHIRIQYPEYRDQQREIGRVYASLRSLREQKEVIGREMTTLESRAREEGAVPFDRATLEEELESVQLMMEQLEKEAREKAVSLIASRDEWAERDETGRELLAWEKQREQDFVEATRRLNAEIDGHAEVTPLESRRVRLVARLDTLRQREAELESRLSN